MKKACISFFLCICLTIVQISAHATQQINFAGVTTFSRAYQAFKKTNPDVNATAVLNPYQTTTELINALLTHGFPYDTFTVSSERFNINTLIDKGYCLNLSQYPAIKEAVSKMIPSIAALVTRNDAIFGVPYNCTIQYMTYNISAWNELNLSHQDIPNSFPELLTFLEKWITQVQNCEFDGYCVVGSFDEELYCETSYSGYLVRLLMNEHILQSAYAGQPLRFNSQSFKDNLERCLKIGKSLYELEPQPNQGIPLFEFSSGMENLKQFISLRLSDDQPTLIPCAVNVCMVYATTNFPELAASFALEMLNNYEAITNNAYLAIDAAPVENPTYEEDVAFWEKNVKDMENKLKDEKLSILDIHDLELELERYKSVLAEVSDESNRYLIGPEQLACYHTYQDKFVIQLPNIFLSRDGEEKNIASLRDRYVCGQISTDQFIAKLDMTAAMLEMENN